MNMAIDRFAAFILTHGRPDHVTTYDALRKQGYTGPIYLIIDNEDETADDYRARYGDQVIMFDKPAVAQTIDEGDNFQDRRAIIYARNASYQIARDLGLEYFLQLDDDYRYFAHKFTPTLHFFEKPVLDLDRVFAVILDFYKSVPAQIVAMGQNGDLIGGAASVTARPWLKRKAMNTLFCSVNRPVTFFGRINEDVNTYVLQGHRGDLFLTFFSVVILQERTQQSAGGMTDIYLSQGTYVKSFYTVMYAPSCVKIGETGYRHRRLHHRINWNAAVPKILHERHRRVETA